MAASPAVVLRSSMLRGVQRTVTPRSAVALAAFSAPSTSRRTLSTSAARAQESSEEPSQEASSSRPLPPHLDPLFVPPSPSSSSSLPPVSSKKEQPPQPTLPLPPTEYLPQTHGHHVATIAFSGHTSDLAVKENLSFFVDFAARSAHALGIPVSRPHAAPTRTSLWTVIKGPFAHKKSQENFVRKTGKRYLKVYDANREVVERWLYFLRVHAMQGVAMRVDMWDMKPLGVGKATFERAEKEFEERSQQQQRRQVEGKEGGEKGRSAKVAAPQAGTGETAGASSEQATEASAEPSAKS